VPACAVGETQCADALSRAATRDAALARIAHAVVDQEANMGLLDVLNGMQHGPRGTPAPSGGTSSGGMSPITMAILGLIAYKAVKSFGGGQPGASPAAPAPGGMPGSGSGPLGGILKGGIGSVLAGGAAGSVISGGLNDLLKQFQQGGLGNAMGSWVGSGANHSVTPGDLGKALGADQINSLMSQSGMSRDDLLQTLSDHLPGVVDKLTPDGRLPTAEEAARIL
jgi:uncharacterized protein YidB (DUF937 family)